jgi:hypothetical protein
MFTIIIPLLLNFFTPILQFKLSSRRINGQIKLPLSIIIFLSLLLAAGLATLSFMISLYNVPADIKCAVGCTIFISIGILNVGFIVPVIGVCSFITYYKLM